MMEEILVQIQTVVEKAKALKDEHAELLQKIEHLENQHKADRDIINIQKNIISELENQLNKATLASQIEEKDLEQKATLKKQISEYIQEIDGIVDFLKMKV